MPVPETANPILVLNSGSSSLKFGVFAAGSTDEVMLLEGSADGIARPSGSLQIRDAEGKTLLAQDHLLESQPEALGKLASALAQYLHAAPAAIGHRIVHGGPHLREHQRITPDVLKTLQASVHFAPLHIPQALGLLAQAQDIFPGIPNFACFDTAFHRTLTPQAAHLPLPGRYFDGGVQRYGFHGLSCESILHQLGSSLPSRAVIAHLGNGSSITAVQEGKSVDTSMGLTPTGGIPMGTRTGDLDPGVLLYLLRTEGLSVDALEQFLNHNCGLAGLSNGESDMQQLLQRSTQNDAEAELAVAVFCSAVRKYIGSYAALMGGLDLLIFTGGIGQHSGEIRTRITTGLDFLGLGPSQGPGSRVLALASQEELQIARHTRALLGTG